MNKECLDSIFKIKWSLCCVTPLVVKDGSYKTVRIDEQDEQNEQEIQISTIYQEPYIQDGDIQNFYKIPASSFRGVIRSFFIEYFIDNEYMCLFNKAKEKTNELETLAKNNALKDSYFNFLYQLFGFSFDSKENDEPIGKKGKIIFNSSELCLNSSPINENNLDVQVRSPIDRISHATKQGGLHRFQEIPENSTFEIEIQINNPTEDDLGFINLCEREIDAGTIRFGGLSGIGKGRLAIKDKEYQYFFKPNHPHLEFNTKQINQSFNDILDCCFENIIVDNIFKFKFFGNEIER